MKTILVVQDMVLKQRTMERFLKRIFGVDTNVLIADNGKIGVDKFISNQENIALIIMDYHMPIMDGEEAIRKIRIIKPNACIIMWTSVTDANILNNIKQAGVQGYIPDVCTKEDLIGIFNELNLRPETQNKNTNNNTGALATSEKENITRDELVTAMNKLSIHASNNNQTTILNNTSTSKDLNIKQEKRCYF